MSKLSIFICLFLSAFKTCEPSFRSNLAAVSETLPEDGRLNFTELSKKYGHTTEQYDVVTEDGYILTIFRILGKKRPVLLIHGLSDTADTFVLRGQGSLGITLANSGYDVWFMNNRGNKYARRHISLDPDDDMEFWDYSFHEIGLYDLSATIDFICNETAQSSLSIIGHSQGTTVQYVLASLRPEYNQKIKVAIALAPGVFYNNPANLLSFFARIGPFIVSLLPATVQELLTDRKIFSNLIKLTCTRGRIGFIFCERGFIFPFAGSNPVGIDSDFFKVLIGHYPAALSVKSLLHYDQLILRKRFRFDYGMAKNMGRYGALEPPDYERLKAITMPVALLVGSNDRFISMKDAKDLRDALPNVVHFEVMQPKLWNHLDFVWGSQMTKFLFPSVLKILEKYNR